MTIFLLNFLIVATNPLAEEAKMTLGTHAEFCISVTDKDVAVAMYQKLGFKKTKSRAEEKGSVSLTDGNIVITLDPSPFPSPTLWYYGSDVASISKRLQGSEPSLELLAGTSEKPTRVSFLLDGGLRVVLDKRNAVPREDVSFELISFTEPPDPKKHYSKLGTFGELAIPVKDFSETAAILIRLGFHKAHESKGPYPWGIFTNNSSVIGVHQTTDFKTPSITFFSKDAADRIATMKKEGFQFKLEMDPSNAILEGPGGEMLFLFGMP